MFPHQNYENHEKISEFQTRIKKFMKIKLFNDRIMKINYLSKLRADLNSLNKWTKSIPAENPNEELFNNK